MSHFVVIVDFSHMFHACRATALNAPLSYDVTETTIENFVGKLRTVKAALKKIGVNGYDLVFAEDQPPLRKLALLPTYRQGREDLSEEKSKVKSYLLQNGSITRFCYSEGNEADDVIASLVRLVTEQDGLFTVVVTSDRDLWQLIGPRVRVYNPIKQEMVTEADIESAFKCRPIHIPLFKALWGDYGDAVPNVMPRTQKQLLPIILKTDGTLEALTTRIEKMDDRFFLTPRCYNRWIDVKAEVERNWQLVKLRDDCELVWE